jgi:hypothetical protein
MPIIQKYGSGYGSGSGSFPFPISVGRTEIMVAKYNAWKKNVNLTKYQKSKIFHSSIPVNASHDDLGVASCQPFLSHSKQGKGCRGRVQGCEVEICCAED